MNTEMFIKITEKIASTQVLEKDNLIISGLGLTPNVIKEYFAKVPIKRSRPIIDMKKNIAYAITKIHNEEYKYNKDLKYSLTDIANLLGLSNHGTIISYFKIQKQDDDLSIFIKNNYLRWIEEKKYIIPFQQVNLKDSYVLLSLQELKSIKFTNVRKIKAIDFLRFINLKDREYFISEV